jgi:hypothetical protein
MPAAPLELVMIGFPGRPFSADIIPALQRLVDRGAVRVVDFVLVTRGDDGRPVIVEIEGVDHELAALRAIVGDVNGLIAEEDIIDLTSALTAGESAGIFLLEPTWAIDFAAAVDAAAGRVLASVRIPPEVVDEVAADKQQDPAASARVQP